MHNWSRVHEYPYVFHHIKAAADSRSPGTSLRIADVGSGVTFFPFALAKLGHSVTCVDNDPVCDRDLRNAIDAVSCNTGEVTSTLISDNALPFADASFDVVYSISVIEHIPNFEETIDEIARILKPGGLFVLTFDINLDRHANRQLNPDQYERLSNALAIAFKSRLPQRTIHPLDMLTPRNSRYPLQLSLTSSARWHAKRALRELVHDNPKGLLGDPSANLTIFVAVLTRNAG